MMLAESGWRANLEDILDRGPTLQLGANNFDLPIDATVSGLDIKQNPILRRGLLHCIPGNRRAWRETMLATVSPDFSHYKPIGLLIRSEPTLLYQSEGYLKFLKSLK